MSANLRNKHPQYNYFLPDWTLMRDAYAGERVVKLKGSVYLPPTSNQVKDGQGKQNTPGQKAYDAYKMRARFPNFTREAIQMAIGMMHNQPPKIILPDAMKDIKSSRGEDLEQLLRRINVEQLLTGRIGLLADLPIGAAVGEDIPYISTYTAEKIINWDDGAIGQLVPQQLNLVVFDETEMVRGEEFSWREKSKFRVICLGPIASEDGRSTGYSYRWGLFDENNPFSEEGLKEATYRGRTLDKIPFVFANVQDLISDPDQPPLLDLANLCMTIYRGEADYRQNLFMQGQDTFVTVGGAFSEDETLSTGAGQRIDLPMGGDAKYVGVSANGIEAQRKALVDDRSHAGSMGAQTLDTTSRERESGTSLHIRMAARTADMTQIAMAGAEALEDVLELIAEWMGEDPEAVEVIPNLEFGDTTLSGQNMVEITTARNLGFPISARSMHQVAMNHGLTDMTYEEELAQAELEKGTSFGPPAPTTPAGGAPTPGDRNPTNDPKSNNQNPKKENTGSAQE